MKLSKFLKISKVFLFCLLITNGATAQYQWQALPIKLDNILVPNPQDVHALYIDPIDSAMWIAGSFWHVNNKLHPSIAVLNLDGSVREIPVIYTGPNHFGLSGGGVSCLSI